MVSFQTGQGLICVPLLGEGGAGRKLSLVFFGHSLEGESSAGCAIPQYKKGPRAQVWELSHCPVREEVSEELSMVALALLQGECYSQELWIQGVSRALPVAG